MSSVMDNFIFESLNNNTFNIKILNETLWDIKERSFKTLYNIQKHITDMNRIDIDISSFIIESNSKYRYDIQIDFIGQNRESYRKSEFYKKDITLSDIVSNPNIFTNSPILFINGEMYTNYTLTIHDGHISINFNIGTKTGQMPISVFDSLVYDRKTIHKFTIDAVYNIGDLVEYTYHNGIRRIVECISDNISGPFSEDNWVPATGNGKMTLLLIPAHASLYDDTINHYILRDMVNDGFPISNNSSSYENDILPSGGGLAFITTDPDTKYRYQLLDGLLTEHDRAIDYRFKYSLSEKQISTIITSTNHTSRPCTMRMIHLKNYMDRIELASDQLYFELPIKDCPMPIENMILFKVDENTGEVFFDHDATLTNHYPNIYSIHRPSEYKSIIYIMYADISPSIDFGYYNELKIYHNNTKNILEKYKNNTIPEKIRNYKHIDVEYDIDDYSGSDYAPDHLQYKINKFKYLISKNGEFYRWYLKRLDMKKTSFIINVSDINLQERIRDNNMAEIINTSEHSVFDEERYLIMIRVDCDEDIVLFVDNNLYVPDEMYRVDNDILVYIPTNIINSNSIISVEKLKDIIMREKLVQNDEYVHINIPSDLNISANDIFLSITTSNGEKYLQNTDGEEKIFNMYVKDDDGEYVEIDPTAFYTHKDIYIDILDDSLKNSDIHLNVNKLAFSYSQKENPKFLLNIKINNDPRNIHVYKNGLRVPDKAIQIDFSEYVNGPHEIMVNLVADDDDIFTIIVNHDKYTEVANIEKIDSSGLIDLTDTINKPFDLGWHDIYINGLKLNESNIEYISPYIIRVKNINTLKNVVIYEKNLDASILSPDSKDDVSSFQKDLVDIEIDTPIVDERPDILDDIIIDYIGFVDEYLSYITLIDPDVQQITDDMLSDYPSILDTNQNMYIDGDKKLKMGGNIIINPDDEYVPIQVPGTVYGA